MRITITEYMNEQGEWIWYDISTATPEEALKSYLGDHQGYDENELKEIKTEWREGYFICDEHEARTYIHELETEPQKVVIEVSGGVAECTTCPDNVKVEIIDHDNA